jgi:hypothetical protein
MKLEVDFGCVVFLPVWIFLMPFIGVAGVLYVVEDAAVV